MFEVLEVMRPFMGWLVRSSVQASLIILLVLGLRFLLWKFVSVRWLYVLWVLLLVRMMMPVLPSISYSPEKFMPEKARQIYNAPIVSENFKRIGPVEFDETDLEDRFGRVEAAGLKSEGENVTGGIEISYFDVFTLVWVLGAWMWLVYMLLSNYWMYRSIVRNRPLTDGRVLNLFEDCKEKMGVNTIVGIVPVKGLSSPALFGFVRPRLLVPVGMLNDLSSDDLRHVFMHELGHIKRHDIFVGWVASILQILHWFNPVVWYGFSKMRHDREVACDNLVLSYAGEGEPREYGRSILNLLERYRKPAYVPSMAGILEDKNQIKRRIRMIAEFKSSKVKFSVIGMLVLCLFGFAAFTSAEKKAEPDEQQKISQETEQDNWDAKERQAYKVFFKAANGGTDSRMEMLNLFNRYVSPKDAKTFRFKYDSNTGVGSICTYTETELLNIVKILEDNRQFTNVKGVGPDGKDVESKEATRSKPFRELKNDDDRSSGRKSIAGGTHVVKFDDGGGQLVAVRIYGSRYGEDRAPNEDFYVYVYDKDMVLIEKYEFPYGRFMKGDKGGNPRGWVMLKVKPVMVPDEFYLAVNFNPEKTKGVYVHHDGGASCNSFVSSMQNPDSLKAFERGDWMVRAIVKNVLPENPVVMESNPEAFKNDVSPELKQLTVQFDRPMVTSSYSWTGGGDTYPKTIGRPSFDSTGTKGILNVELEPGRVYWVGINSPSYKNFKSQDGKPANWYIILFATADENGKPTPIPEDLLQRAKQINSSHK